VQSYFTFVFDVAVQIFLCACEFEYRVHICVLQLFACKAKHHISPVSVKGKSNNNDTAFQSNATTRQQAFLAPLTSVLTRCPCYTILTQGRPQDFFRGGLIHKDFLWGALFLKSPFKKQNKTTK